MILNVELSLNVILSAFLGTYRDGISPDGHVLSDHMLLGAVVATILILDNTAQVRKVYLLS
jgi:hypothetical protein